MTLIHAIRRPAGILPGLAPGVLASLTAVMPAAVAIPRPGPPGWNTHPPPAHLHPLAAGGIPGWQQALMAVTVVLLVAILVAIAYPGPGSTAAGERAHRLSGDHLPRHADLPGTAPPRPDRPSPTATTGPVPGLRKGTIMCGSPRIRRRTAPDGFPGRFIQNIAATASAAAGPHWPAPATTRPRRSATTRPRLRPHATQLGMHCPRNPAGCWASHTGAMPARRPWRLSCSPHPGPGRTQLIPFDDYGGAERSR